LSKSNRFDFIDCPNTSTNYDNFCDHDASYYSYANSIVIPSCQFIAYPCADYSAYLAGNCSKCNGTCNIMGYLASKDKELGNLYLTTPNSSCYLSNLKTEYDEFSYNCSRVNHSSRLSQLIFAFLIDFFYFN